MDNNFSDILNIFKRLNEGAMDEADAELRDIVAREDFDALYQLFSANTPAGRYVQELYQDVSIDHRLHPDDDFEQIEEIVFDRLADQFGGVAEGAKFDFAGEKRGQKPGDQWRGTDRGTPGTKLVGASESVEQECAEPTSLMDKLKARWEKTKQEKGLLEVGAITATAGAPNPNAPGLTQPEQDPKQQAQKLQQTTGALNQLKSAGLQIPNMSQAVQSTIKSTVPGAQPTQQDKNVGMGFGNALEKIVTDAQPSELNQLKTIIKKVQQQG
jgi:hypothetical protein